VRPEIFPDPAGHTGYILPFLFAHSPDKQKGTRAGIFPTVARCNGYFLFSRGHFLFDWDKVYFLFTHVKRK
jgi:hypothetical protein